MYIGHCKGCDWQHCLSHAARGAVRSALKASSVPYPCSAIAVPTLIGSPQLGGCTKFRAYPHPRTSSRTGHSACLFQRQPRRVNKPSGCLPAGRCSLRRYKLMTAPTLRFQIELSVLVFLDIALGLFNSHYALFRACLHCG